MWKIRLTSFLYVQSIMSFVLNCYTQLAIMLNHQEIFFCSPIIHYQMKVMKKKGKKKVQGVPQSQAATHLRHEEKEETDKTKQIEQTHEKH